VLLNIFKLLSQSQKTFSALINIKFLKKAFENTGFFYKFLVVSLLDKLYLCHCSQTATQCFITDNN
jgi:hypothetical protein